jgi:hypothetical protein
MALTDIPIASSVAEGEGLSALHQYFSGRKRFAALLQHQRKSALPKALCQRIRVLGRYVEKVGLRRIGLKVEDEVAMPIEVYILQMRIILCAQTRDGVIHQQFKLGRFSLILTWRTQKIFAVYGGLPAVAMCAQNAGHQ